MSDLNKDIEYSISKLEKRLAQLDTERAKLISELDAAKNHLVREQNQKPPCPVFPTATIDQT